MKGLKEWQKWVYLWAVSPVVGDIYQHEKGWGDMMGNMGAVVQAEVLACTGCTLILEGGELLDGDWVQHDSWTAPVAGMENIVLSRGASREDQKRLYRFLRWRVDGTTSNWETMFRFTIIGR